MTSTTTGTKVAHWTLRASGGLLLLLGLIIWTGKGDQLIPVHDVLGFVLVLSLWTIAAIASRSGVPIGLVTLAVAWGLIAPILGLTQDKLVTGDWHWTIQVLHLVIGVGALGLGERLVISMRQNKARAGSSQRPS
jgi:hypothetical protein